MIIELLLNLIYNILDKLLVFNIPSLPDSVMEYVETAFEYIAAGAGIVANYTPYQYLMTLFGILLVIDAAMLLYRFVMWIVKKIPMLHVS